MTFTLVFQSLIKFATDSYVAHREGIQAPGIGKGIGLAIALVFLQLIGSLCQHHFFYRATSTGRPSSRRSHHGNLFSFSSLDYPCSSNAAQWQISKSHLDRRLPNRTSAVVSSDMFWAAPIQMAICLALLISNLGPSAAGRVLRASLFLPRYRVRS